MNPSDQNQAVGDGSISNPLQAMQPGEQVIFQIKRHPIGIFGIYFMTGLLLIAIAVIVFVLAPSVAGDHRGDAMGIGTVAFFVFALICLGFVFIANKVYWGNSWILTSDSITQVSQSGLFDKQSSQLSLGNLEDVTAIQDGLLPHMFNYGLLKAETAGERSKFVFLYCPDPNKYAQQVLMAREQFEQGHRGGKVGTQQDSGTDVDTEA